MQVWTFFEGIEMSLQLYFQESQGNKHPSDKKYSMADVPGTWKLFKAISILPLHLVFLHWVDLLKMSEFCGAH